MRPLRFVALSEDGTHLVLAPDVPEAIDNGERFALPVDERLRAASRGDVSRLGQIEIELESNLRPREIQSRIRSGETPESVASAANVRLEKVMRYAYPVLQERAQIAERAQQARVKLEDSTQTPTLSELVASRLSLISVDTDTVEWDARRLDDGTWEVLSSWKTSEKTVTANWRYDVSARTVTPGDRDTIEFIDPPAPRLSAVPGPPVTSYDPTEGHDPYSTYDIDDTAPTGPIPLVRGDQRTEESGSEPAAPFGRNRRSFRQRRDREPAMQERATSRQPEYAEPQQFAEERAYDRRTAPIDDDLVGIDDLLEPDVPEIEVPAVSGDSGPPPGVREPQPSPEPAPVRNNRQARANRNAGRVSGSLPGQSSDLVTAPASHPLEAAPARGATEPEAPAASAAAERAPDPEPDEAPAPPQPATSRGGKPRIPSWDDIVFGVKRNPK